MKLSFSVVEPSMPDGQTHSTKPVDPMSYARFGDDSWYAIPPYMEEAYRRAGAEVVRSHTIPRGQR
jgi:hypothetical protein